ncbi:MAG: efflux RND transporter periplasmic adaptor subunit, partial [Nevskiales bacterium]
MSAMGHGKAVGILCDAASLCRTRRRRRGVFQVMAEAANGPRRTGSGLAFALAVLTAVGPGVVAGDRCLAQQVNSPSTAAAVPVSIAPASRRDVPIYLRGLGAVQAFNSVLVRARVDGTLNQVPVTEGQEVKQGELLAVIDPRPFQATLDAAAAKKSQDEADLLNARQDLARYSALAQKNFASHQQVDTQQALVNHLVAAITGDDAAIESAKLNLSFCYITSPIQGIVGLRQVDPGNLVHASDATGIMTVTQIHPISVLFTLPQEDLPRINVAMQGGKLPVVAFGADARTELDQGTLLTPDNAIDASTGTIKLKATFPNPHNTLWPGQFVNARLQLGTDRNVLTVLSVA